MRVRPRRGEPRAEVRLRVLGVPEVIELIGVSRATLHRWEANGSFPARRQLGPARVGWLERDVLRWLESRPPAKGTAEAQAQAAQGR